jgi:DNA polymerase III subunit chi
MTRIDFYQITESRLTEDALVCKLCQKAYESGQKVLLLTRSEQHSQHLDQLLWTHDDESFIPHDQQQEEGVFTPILIKHEADPRGERQLLINLTQDIPIFFAQFERVLELVTEDNKVQARSHYSYYKERGYPLNHHTL